MSGPDSRPNLLACDFTARAGACVPVLVQPVCTADAGVVRDLADFGGRTDGHGQPYSGRYLPPFRGLHSGRRPVSGPVLTDATGSVAKRATSFFSSACAARPELSHVHKRIQCQSSELPAGRCTVDGRAVP